MFGPAVCSSDASWFALIQRDHGHIDDALALFQTTRRALRPIEYQMAARTEAPSPSNHSGGGARGLRATIESTSKYHMRSDGAAGMMIDLSAMC